MTARLDPFRTLVDTEAAAVPPQGRGPALMPTVPQAPRERELRLAQGWSATPWGPAPVGRAMRRRRPLVAWLVLPVMTLGLAHPVWYLRIHREMAAFDPRRDEPVTGPVLVLLLFGWTLVAPLASAACTAGRVAATQRAAGLPATCRPVVAALLFCLLGAHVAYLQAQLNRVVDAYGAEPGSRVALRG